jgi:hypothetical protein
MTERRALDLDAVRLLSLWFQARRELQAHLELFTAFGPSATEQISRNVVLVSRLEQEAHLRFLAFRDHLHRVQGSGMPSAQDP